MEADLETLNNNDDVDFNDMPFDESKDQIDETVSNRWNFTAFVWVVVCFVLRYEYEHVENV